MGLEYLQKYNEFHIFVNINKTINIMKCPHCKEEIGDDAKVCQYCGAYKSTLGESRFLNKRSIFSVGLYLSWWMGTVGLIWVIVLFGSFTLTAYPLLTSQSLFFEKTSWDCRLDYDYVFEKMKVLTDEELKKIGITRRVNNGKTTYSTHVTSPLNSVETNDFRFFSLTENLEKSKPSCASDENKIKSEKIIKGTTDTTHHGVQLVVENVVISEPVIDKKSRSSASFMDYAIGIVLSILTLIIGIPLAKLVTKAWDLIFKPNKIVWVKRKY